jgi:3-hydroxyacyl-CoA dehydrogenase/enoyl-CoA hydratase/3-hydroxybutyryl-CoA epimerase
MILPTFENLTLEIAKTAGLAIAKLDTRGRSVNVLSRQLLSELFSALDVVAGETSLKLLVIQSQKKSSFIAGADIRELHGIRSADEARTLSERGQQLMNKLAALPIPTMAIIQGACLGGGLELALACDYRLAVGTPGTQLGLPEVELGLIPGWGGTQRLPRLIGLERALQLIVGGRRIDSSQALRWGLVDRLVPTLQDLVLNEDPLVVQAMRDGKRLRAGLPLLTWRQKFIESTALGRRLIYSGTERILKRRVPEDMPAPAEALAAVRTGISAGFETGLAQEREAVGRLAVTTACRNLVSLFVRREEMRSAAPAGKAETRRIGVVGAGTMGAGIIELAALKGCEVFVQEANQDALGAGVLRVASLFQKALEKGVLSDEEFRRNLARIRPTISWEGFNKAELVIEAAIEELSVKKQIFRELEARTGPHTILATNTSSLTVSNIQEGLRHPQRVAGLHFFNPVHRMPLVEVAGTPVTADGTLQFLSRWASTLGKTPVVVKDSPGFLVNRILMPCLNEAVLLVLEGMDARTIDRLMVRFGMPLGPLELLDQIGLDVAAQIARAMEPIFADRLPHSGVFDFMCSKGWLGTKSRLGFYVHTGKRKRVHHTAAGALRKSPRKPPVPFALPPALRLQQARERMVLLMCKEAFLCLDEQIVPTAEGLDMAMVLGSGWAPHRGGPICYATQRGTGAVRAALESLAKQLGSRFDPPPRI